MDTQETRPDVRLAAFTYQQIQAALAQQRKDIRDDMLRQAKAEQQVSLKHEGSMTVLTLTVVLVFVMFGYGEWSSVVVLGHAMTSMLDRYYRTDGK